MQLHYPLNPTTGAEDATQLPWTNGVPSTGVEGSYPPFTAVVEPMTELANLIAQAGFTGSSSDLFQVLRAVRSGQLDFDATDTGSANAAICQIGIPYTALQSGMPFTFIKAASANTTTTPTLTITDLSGNNGLTGTIVKSNGSALAAGDLPANALITVRARASGVFAVVSLVLPSDVLALTRIRLTANLTIYINSSTGSDSNTGTLSAPFQTLQAAVNYAYTMLDLAGYVVTFSSASSAFTAGVVFYGTLLGQKSANQVVFALGASSITSTGSCFFAASGAAFVLSSTGPLQSSGTAYGQGSGIFVGPGSTVNFSGVNFSTCVSGHVGVSNGGIASILGPYTISGNAPTHFNGQPYGFINNPTGAVTITLFGTPAFSTAFAYCYSGYLFVPLLTFSGSATGTQYFIDGYGAIYTGTALAGYFPGSVAGTNGVLSTLGFTTVQATSGYMKLPSSQGTMFIQWGTYAGGAQDPSIAYPIVFPTACTSVVVTSNTSASNTTTFETAQVYAFSKTNFGVQQRYFTGGSAGASPNGFTWLAIGY